MKLSIGKVEEKLPGVRIITDPETNSITACEITHGEYAGILYVYDNVQLNENDDGFLEVKFTKLILENKNLVDTDTEDFNRYIGEILLNIIESSIDGGCGEETD